MHKRNDLIKSRLLTYALITEMGSANEITAALFNHRHNPDGISAPAGSSRCVDSVPSTSFYLRSEQKARDLFIFIARCQVLKLPEFINVCTSLRC